MTSPPSYPPLVEHLRGKPISSKENNVVLNAHKYLKSKHDDLTQQSLAALTAQQQVFLSDVYIE